MRYWAITLVGIAALNGSFAEEPNSVDHAGIIQSLDDEDFAAGETIYKNLCTHCHGADGVNAPLPTARAFGSGELKFGKDPYSMFLTLTNGNGLMGPQTWMNDRERYQVIHYIRETFMRTMRSDFEEIHDGYLEGLPTVNVVVDERDTIPRDFGPALASQLGRDLSSVLTVKLNSELTLSYNLHTMDQAGVWTGGFLDLLDTQHYRERGGGVAEPDGESIPGLKGWAWGHDGSLDYATDHLLPRGPMPQQWMSYRGHYLHNNQVVLSYSIDGRDILEAPSAPKGFTAVQHNFQLGPGEALLLSVGQSAQTTTSLSGRLPSDSLEVALGNSGDIHVLGEPGDESNRLSHFFAATSWGDTEGFSWRQDEQNRLVLSIPASTEKRVFQVVRFAGEGDAELLSFANFIRSKKQKLDRPFNPAGRVEGGERRWPHILETSGVLGSESEAYTIDKLELPPDHEDNPYNTWFRTSALAFFPDGRLVVSTHGGDIWIVSGVDHNLENLRWNRFAAGLYEPFGLQVVDDKIYVTCKDRLTRLHDLNGDGEADFYESFSADDDVSTFFHAFNFDLQCDAEGNFYYAKSGQYTDYKEPGSVIKVSPDGKTREIYCTGFRTPNGMGMMPDGRPTVSDNQGGWMPASKISVCDSDGFYGYVQTFRTEHWAPDGGAIDHTQVVPPDTFDQPIIWMPQNFDNSSGGQVWIDDDRWGPLSGRLLHTSFGKGWLYYLMMQEVDGVDQAAIVKLDLDDPTGIHRAHVNPFDGQVYAVGLNGWNGGGREGLAQGGISRYRYTGAESKLLTDVVVKEDGITLEFNFALDPEAAVDPERYEIFQWDYAWTRAYGSEQFSAKQAPKEGEDEVVIEDFILGPDRKSVHLVIPDIQPVHQVEINFELEGVDGGIFEEQAYLTINAVPGGKHSDMKELTRQRVALREEQKAVAASNKPKKLPKKKKK
ncbi:MAG: DUF6797 domain-containing protein [Verrucomicrobiota bacterium]